VADKRWKRVEREHCRELGGERSGPTGRDLPDCIDTPGIGLEVKSYKTFTFLTKDWEQAVDNATKLGVVPALVVKETGQGGRHLVQMREFDFTRMWVWSKLRPIPLHQQDTGRGLVRIAWPDFVRLYRATSEAGKWARPSF